MLGRKSVAALVAACATSTAFTYVGSYTFIVSSYGTLSMAIDISNWADGSSALAFDFACVGIVVDDSFHSYLGTNSLESRFACLALRIVFLSVLAGREQMSTFNCKGMFLTGKIYRVQFCSCHAIEVVQMVCLVSQTFDLVACR